MIINQIGSFFTKITGGWIFGDPAEDATLEVTNGDVAIDGTGATGLTYTMPSSSQTLIGRSSTDTLTNKTIDANGTGNSITNIETGDIAAATLVTAADTIASNDNDTTWPTSAAVKDYADATWWEELGRTTLGSAGDTISVTSIPARKYLKLIISVQGTGGTIGVDIRFNNDTGNNYASNFAAIGASPASTLTSQSAAVITGATTVANLYYEGQGVNISALDKLFKGDRVTQETAGAGTAPGSARFVTKWANTSAQITRVDVLNLSGTGDYAIGSEVVVLGHN